MKTPREKYMNDPEYHRLVNMLESFIETARFTPSELREATVLACINYEMRHVRESANMRIAELDTTLDAVISGTASALGCEADNEHILLAIQSLQKQVRPELVDAYQAQQERIAELQDESNRLHLVAVTAGDRLRHETRKYDERLAELERKLAEQRARLDIAYEVTLEGANPDYARGYHAALFKVDSSASEELTTLLAKAKEEGRREAVPDAERYRWLRDKGVSDAITGKWLVVYKGLSDHSLLPEELDAAIDAAMLAATPKPEETPE